jgi:hypothetical protein
LEDHTTIDDNEVLPNYGGCGSTNGGRGGTCRDRGDDCGDFYGRHDRHAEPEGYGRGSFQGQGRDKEGADRPPRPNFPSFDGESDPLTWINK